MVLQKFNRVPTSLYLGIEDHRSYGQSWVSQGPDQMATRLISGVLTTAVLLSPTRRPKTSMVERCPTVAPQTLSARQTSLSMQMTTDYYVS